MLSVRKSDERGHAEHGWLKTWHSFSFADYYDPQHMHFGPLRVINDDRIAGGKGFPMHPHRDMEIITYMLEGALEHKDSMGNGSVIQPGDVQRMTAGTGVFHSEVNPLPDQPAHLLQIWIIPDKDGYEPGYEQKEFTEPEKRGRLLLVASGDGREGSVTINQDVNIFAGLFDGEESAQLALDEGRMAWLQVARGSLVLNGVELEAGDGVGVRREEALELDSGTGAEILLFEMPASDDGETT
ncbi:MAG: pirin family protein [Gammaproteobacteria bacterium]|nr:pirin family protein [Gammaproteobacteria bacterium]